MSRALVSVLLLAVVVFVVVQQTHGARWGAPNFYGDVLEQVADAGTGHGQSGFGLIRQQHRKRSDGEVRLCGGRLIKEASRICNGCFGFMGLVRMSKRSPGAGRTVTDRCCKDKCSESWIKENLCSNSC